MSLALNIHFPLYLHFLTLIYLSSELVSNSQYSQNEIHIRLRLASCAKHGRANR